MKITETYEGYKDHIIEILYGVALDIHNDNFESILKNKIKQSPNEDGSDNHFINFDSEGTDFGVDIEQSIYKLQLLRGECR